MGQVSKQTKKYSKPSHPWQKERIILEKQIKRDFGLKNKKELWKFKSLVKKDRDQAKNIVANRLSSQSQKEGEQLLNKLKKYSMIKKDAKIEDVLDLEIKDLLDKRLQTIVYKKGLARSIKQSRQFIIHGHIFIDNKKVSVPSFLVPEHLENKISFKPTSSLSKADHPERMDLKTKKELKEKEIAKETIKEKKEIVKEAIEQPKEEVKENA